MIKKITFLIIIATMIFLSACDKDKNKTDDEKIQEYLTENNLEATKHESGLYYIIETEGTEGHPTLSNDITIFYKGYLTNGNVFDQTGVDPSTFPLSNLIEGWQIGIPLIQKHGRILLFIPSELGYGSNTVGDIPANSVLIFEIDLVDFSK